MGDLADLADLGGWPAVLSRLFARQDLGAELACAALGSILVGDATSAQIAAFAAGLRIKGESVAELAGCVAAMRRHGERVTLDVDNLDVIDTCGTGGDRSGTINVSTIAALVAVGAGATVCKHGGRAASSRSGSADVLEALGVVVDLGPRDVERCVRATGIGFCLATRFHPAMRHAAPVRQELGVATVFNFLGPLVNPAGVLRQVVGVGDPAMAATIAGALDAGGAVHAMIVYGEDGLDELSTVTTSHVIELVRAADGSVARRHFTVEPASLGLAPATGDALRGGSPEHNAERARAILAGEASPQSDLVALNAAAALVVAGIAADLSAGLELAFASLHSGAAEEALRRLVASSHGAVGTEG